jgi:hypothetical protein
VGRPLGSKNSYYVPQPSGPDAHHWKGGWRISSGGYVQRFVGEPGRRYRFEHELVAEQVLGHPLPPDACIHHVNGIKTDNANANLVICQDDSYHFELHRKMAVRRAGGNPWTDRLCCLCRRPKPATVFYRQSIKRSPYNPDGRASVCSECGRAKTNAWRQRRLAVA